MCANCPNPMPEEPPVEFAEVTPERLFSQLGMANESILQAREKENDERIRLSCLELAVRVKGEQGDSRKVLSSANSYYDFVVGKDKHEDVNV